MSKFEKILITLTVIVLIIFIVSYINFTESINTNLPI